MDEDVPPSGNSLKRKRVSSSSSSGPKTKLPREDTDFSATTATATTYTDQVIEHRSDEERVLLDRLREDYPGIDIPRDITPATFAPQREGFFQVFESSSQHDPLACPDEETAVPEKKRRPHRRKKEATLEDKVYRSDREFVKRHSHRKMIWFFRRVGLRHPAAVRTHLERVKHPEFELPNLQCVYPHPELAIACDDRFEDDDGDEELIRRKQSCRAETTTTNMTYYQMYCATSPLVERVKSMVGRPKARDTDYNKRVLTFIADIVGRLLWHSNRTHTVMFAKSDHYDRDCFLLYSRQAEPTPFMMRSDSFFCRRHDSDKFRCIAPQPDLTRTNSTRLSNESSIYVVGCNAGEMWETFPYEYRATRSRPMKSLCDQIRKLDPSVVEYAFSAVNAFLNGSQEHSPYVEVASKTSCDVLSVLLADLKNITTTDHHNHSSPQDFVERFVTLGVLNVHAMLKSHAEITQFGNYCGDGRTPHRLDQIVLHNVRYRRDARELRTNRVYYYRNSKGFVCSLSLLDDLFEDRASAVDVSLHGERQDRSVYFYDLVQPFEYDDEVFHDVNDLVLYSWDEASTMIQESSHTIGQRFNTDLLKKPPPDDPFYPKSDMSAIDLAIDRMLERAIKHSKKLKLLTPKEGAASSKHSKGATSNTENTLPPGLLMEADLKLDKNVIVNSLSITGENRLRDGYVSPVHPDFETDHHVEHNGQHYHVKISVGGTNSGVGGVRETTKVDYGPKPCLQVDNRLTCVYMIDPNDTRQIRISHGSIIADRNHGAYMKLQITDKILRVFSIQATGDNSYLVNPYVYFVFRNMPICEIDKTLVEQMWKGSTTTGGDAEQHDQQQASSHSMEQVNTVRGVAEQQKNSSSFVGKNESSHVVISQEDRRHRQQPASSMTLFQNIEWENHEQQQRYILPEPDGFFDANPLSNSHIHGF